MMRGLVAGLVVGLVLVCLAPSVHAGSFVGDEIVLTTMPVEALQATPVNLASRLRQRAYTMCVDRANFMLEVCLEAAAEQEDPEDVIAACEELYELVIARCTALRPPAN